MASTSDLPFPVHEAMEHAAKGIQLSFWTFMVTHLGVRIARFVVKRQVSYHVQSTFCF
jgi:hypothetical protein